MEKEFVRVRGTVDYVVSVSLLVIGCAIVLAPTSVAVNIVGCFLIFAGILLIFILHSSWKEVGSGEKYKKVERYFPQSSKDRISKAAASDIENIDISDEDKGNGLRLDVYYSRKSGKSYVRVYEYIPYKYEPASPYYEYPVEKISKLID